MRRRCLPFLIAFLLLPCLPGTAGTDALRLAEERLAARLDQDQAQCAKTRTLSIVSPSWGDLAAAVCKAQKNLRHLVDKTPRETLPEVLVGLFIDELSERGPQEEYPPMEDYVVIFGAPAVAPLMARYDEVSENKKKNLLRTFGEIGSEAPLPLLRSEALRLKPATLSMAAYALCKIRKEAAREDLLPLLRDPRVDARGVTTIARKLISLADSGWCDIVLDHAETGRIPFETVVRLESFDKYPERVVTAHLDYLLERWVAGDSQTVACILYQVHAREAVRRWFPIYDYLLRDKYGYGGAFFSLMGANCPHFRHARKHPLLDRIENTLIRGDVEEWIQKPSPAWGVYLHLRELYHSKGGPPLEVEDLSFQLVISALDETNDVLLGEFRGRFRNGEDREIVLPSDRPDGAPYRITLAPQLQKDVYKGRWTIHIPLFMVDKPIGCGSPFTIPLESSDSLRTKGADRVIRWQVRHVGPPPEKT